MKAFMKIAKDKDKKYVVSESKVKNIEKILRLLIMPKGLKAGMTLYECTSGYQWLFYIGMLAVVYRNNPEKRKYETMRKNEKVF